jgi:hypothetical protein
MLQRNESRAKIQYSNCISKSVENEMAGNRERLEEEESRPMTIMGGFKTNAILSWLDQQ